MIVATCLGWWLGVRTSRQLKRSEVTAQLIRTWNGVELSLVRREVLTIAKEFYEGDHSVVERLLNDDFEQYVKVLHSSTTGSNGLYPAQNLLIFLYFFVEVTANYDMGLLNNDVMNRTFVS